MTINDPGATMAADDDTDLLDVEVAWHDRAVVVTVGGDLDLLTAPLLTDELTEQFAKNPAVVILDLDDVRFLGSSGLACLVGARDAAERAHADLRIVCTSDNVLRPLTATALIEVFDVRPDLDAALA